MKIFRAGGYGRQRQGTIGRVLVAQYLWLSNEESHFGQLVSDVWLWDSIFSVLPVVSETVSGQSRDLLGSLWFELSALDIHYWHLSKWLPRTTHWTEVVHVYLCPFYIKRNKTSKSLCHMAGKWQKVQVPDSLVQEQRGWGPSFDAPQFHVQIWLC